MLLTITQAQALFDEHTERLDPSIFTNIKAAPENIADDNDVEMQSTTSTWSDLGITDPTLLNNLNCIHCESPLPDVMSKHRIGYDRCDHWDVHWFRENISIPSTNHPTYCTIAAE
jgi:hypothetical protein